MKLINMKSQAPEADNLLSASLYYHAPVNSMYSFIQLSNDNILVWMTGAVHLRVFFILMRRVKLIHFLQEVRKASYNRHMMALDS